MASEAATTAGHSLTVVWRGHPSVNIGGFALNLDLRRRTESDTPMRMPHPLTTSTMLASLREADNDQAWQGFDARYRPILIGVARRVGLSEEDAAEVAQQALAEFARDYRLGKYERGRGRLSSWLIGIAQHRALDCLRRRKVRKEARGVSAMVDIPCEREHLSAAWEVERQHAILQEALTVLRSTSRTNPESIRAFELVALRGVPARQAADECGMSVDDVYVAKNRVTNRLRDIVRELTDAYDAED